jgi:hypothetical protein
MGIVYTNTTVEAHCKLGGAWQGTVQVAQIKLRTARNVPDG